MYFCDMQNSEEIFSIALGFKDDKILNIEIGFERGSKFKMPDGKFYTDTI